MKRLLLTLVLAVVGMSLFAASQATLTLTGTVAASTNITVTPITVTFDLTQVQTNTPIATVNEQSNDYHGYTVVVASTNAGTGSQPFFKDPVSGNMLDYTLWYWQGSQGTQVTFLNGQAVITSAGTKTAPAGVNKTMTISYTPDPTLSASSAYTDTLTFTIAGN